MSQDGKISIIMGIYNCEETLPEAIESIIAQTYTNWELVMCDDASTDGTYEVASKYCRKYSQKMLLLKNDVNMGLNYTLNKCLAIADGEFVARMDGDDISYPERFKKEVDALLQHPEISIVSTDMEFFDNNGIWGRTHTKKNPERLNFLKSTPFCHAACMVRKEAFDKVEGYSVDSRLLRVEDYHLWVKMYSLGFKGMNIQEPLYKMRDDRNAQKRKKYKYRINEAYVKVLAVKKLRLPLYGYFFAVKPLLIGILPSWLYRIIHRNSQGRRVS